MTNKARRVGAFIVVDTRSDRRNAEAHPIRRALPRSDLQRL